MFFKIRILMLLGMLLFPFMPQSQELDKIYENVKVVNIEIPVRVFHNGKAVSGLNRDDFSLQINGQHVPINGFYERKMNLGSHAAPDNQPSRLFTLIFNAGDLTGELIKSIDTFFNDIFKPHDRLIVITNTTFIQERIIDDPQKEMANLKRLLNLDVQTIKKELHQLEINLDSDVSGLFQMLDGENDQKFNALRSFFDIYLQRLREFRAHYLNPDNASYVRLATYLKTIPAEKWILNFIYLGMFPQIITNSALDKIIQILQADPYIGNDAKALMIDVEKELNVINTTPQTDIAKLFQDTGASIHTLFIRPHAREVTEQFRYKPIALDSENVLSELTQRTGGKMLDTNKFTDFYTEIMSHDDICYVLSYTLSEDSKTRKNDIKIRLKNSKYRLSYDDGIRSIEYKETIAKELQSNPAPRIERLIVTHNMLGIELKQIKMENTGATNQGHIRLRIRIVDNATNTLFDRKKEFQPGKDPYTLQIKLPDLKPSEYFVIVEANDLLTGKNDIQTIALQPGQKN